MLQLQLELGSSHAHSQRMDDLIGLSKTELLFDQLLEEENLEDHLYVYLFENSKKLYPALLKNVTPFADLIAFLQRRYGGRSYCAIIRRGKKMLLSRVFHIAQPLNSTPEEDVYAYLEKLRREER